MSLKHLNYVYASPNPETQSGVKQALSKCESVNVMTSSIHIFYIITIIIIINLMLIV